MKLTPIQSCYFAALIDGLRVVDERARDSGTSTISSSAIADALVSYVRTRPQRRREYCRRYHAHNRVRLRALNRARYLRRREKAIAYARAHNHERYLKNGPQMRARCALYRRKNRARLAARGRSQTAQLSDYYVRCKLFGQWKGSRPRASFTADEISAKRATTPGTSRPTRAAIEKLPHDWPRTPSDF